VFLVLQLSVLVTWAWDVSDNVLFKITTLEKEQTDERNNKQQINCYQTLLIFGTLILDISCIVLWGLMFWWFGKSGCELNQTLITLTIIGVIVLNVMSLSVERGSVFVTAIVSFYCTYLCYSGLQSQPESSCNAFFGKKNTLNLWLGIVITIAALSYAAYSVSSSTNQKHRELENENDVKESSEELEIAKEKKNSEDVEEAGENDHLGPSNYDDLEEGKRSSKEKKESKNQEKINDPDKNEKKQNVVFHVCMAFAAVYFAMIFTNWATDTASDHVAKQRGNLNLSINIASEWLCFLLYLWTLCAPKIFPNRAFD